MYFTLSLFLKNGHIYIAEADPANLIIIVSSSLLHFCFLPNCPSFDRLHSFFSQLGGSLCVENFPTK